MNIIKRKSGYIFRWGRGFLALLLLTGMLCFTGCDPMQSAPMQDSTFVELLKLFGYKPDPDGEIWIIPCQYTRISSLFGEREHPVDGEERFHKGMDLAAPKGTPIYATRAGTVVFAGWDTTGGGNYVSIDHGDGFKSQYMHMDAFVVEEGQEVSQGEIIGYVGDTGVTTGYHLHFALRKYNKKTKQWDHVNPANYINFDQ